VYRNLNLVEETSHSQGIGNLLLQHALGILTKLQSFFIPAEFEVSFLLKSKIVRGIQQMTSIIGSQIFIICNQLLGFLQTLSKDKRLLQDSLVLWKTFVFQLPKEALQETFFVICLNLLELDLPQELEHVAIDIFQYLVVQNFQIFSSQIGLIVSRIPSSPKWKSIKDCAANLVSNKSFHSQLVDSMELITHENNIVVLEGLKKLREVLTANQIEIGKLISTDTVDKRIKAIIQKLCILIHHQKVPGSEIVIIACECLGIIGPIDPVKIDISIRLNQLFGAQVDLSHFEGALSFVCSLIESYLVPTFRATQDATFQSLLAFTIQNALHWCGFSREVISEAALNTQKLKPTTRSILANRWKRFPKHIVTTIMPFIESRYKVAAIEKAYISYPYFPSCTNYGNWIENWSLDLLHKISSETKRAIFRLFENVIAASDTNITQILLPHLVHQVIIAGSEVASEEVYTEIIFLLSHSSSSEFHLLALQLIFHIMEYFSKWIRNARIKMSQKRSRSAAPTNLKAIEEELLQIERFLIRIPQDMLSTASIRCDSYPRALLHLEHHIRDNELSNENNAGILLNQMQRIYAQLNDSDALEGLSTKIVNPSLEQQIIHHEVCGRWSAAQSCYEVLLQKNPQETTYQLGLLECLQNMGHYESMITYSRGILATNRLKSKQIIPYSITASWKLEDWSSLETMINIPLPNQEFEAIIGKLLLFLQKKSIPEFQLQINELRKSLISSTVAATMESYHRAYNSILQLSVLYDIEQFQKVILQTPSVDSALELDRLNRIWQSRLDSMAPSFKAKETVLSMRRGLLAIALQQETPNRQLIQEQKGWLWLETAKQSRKNDYFQTAYSAILQAKLLISGPARVELAKWYRFQNHNFEAISELRVVTGRDLKTFEKYEDKCLLSNPEHEKKVCFCLRRLFYCSLDGWRKLTEHTQQ
jgi:serine/threonine-protein kinase ATR